MNKKISSIGKKAKDGAKQVRESLSKTLFSPRFAAKERIHFAKSLSYLVHGGVPIVESLIILKKQNKSKGKNVFYDTVISDVSSGQYLSSSLAKFENIFNGFAVNIIRVGEESGILNQNLNYLAEDLRKKQVLKQKIVSAAIYPIFITIATLLLTALLTVFVFPKILPIFRSLHVAIPFTTQLLISVSIFLQSYGILTVFVLALFCFIFWICLHAFPRFRLFIQTIMLKVPLVGGIVRNFNMANFCRTLGLLLRSQIVLSDAVSITASTTTNLFFQKEIQGLSQSVIRGDRISSYLETRTGVFPDMLSHMIAVGEATGNLPETLMYLSALYENEVDEMTKNLSSAVEPALMICMGLIIGIVAVSVIAPIYQITNNLRPR